MKQKRLLTLLVTLILCTVVSMAGYAMGDQGEPETEGPVTVSFWHIDIQDEFEATWDQIVAEYEALHPDVDIEVTVLENEAFKSKITTVMQSGDPPDIFRSWGGGVMNAYAEAGLLRDISPELQGEWGDSIGEGALGVYSYQGKYYGVPYDMGAVGFWYNKELFTQAGIPNPPATWSAYLDACEKLKAIGVTPIALGEADKWPGHFYWVYLAVRLGGKAAFDKAYSGTGSFTDQPFVKAGELLLNLTALDPFQDGFLGATYGDQSGIMADGLAGMELMGQWAPYAQVGNAEDGIGLGDKLGFFPFPMVQGGAGKPTDVMGGGNGFIVGKDAPDEAVDFLKFITNLENNSLLTEKGFVTPTVKGAEDSIQDPLMKEVQKLVSAAEYFQLYYDQYLPPAVGEAVKDATQGLFAGTLTPLQAAQMIEDAMALER
jgi:raffinose/stachyose/melibiose transport system substrate-binding protein